MKILTKKEIIPAAIILILFLFAVAFYFSPCLPDKIPTHWNWRGEIDGYSAKTFALFFFPALCLFIYLLMLFAPLFDPFRKNYEKFALAYYLIRLALTAFLGFLYFYTLFRGLGFQINIVYFIIPLLTLLFIVIGFCLPQFKKNYFVGIRTPWTLQSDKVWEKTHKLASRTLILASTLSFFSIFFGSSYAFWIFLALILVGLFIPVFYSYFLYKKLGLFRENESKNEKTHSTV